MSETSDKDLGRLRLAASSSRARERGSNSKDVSKDNAGDMSIFGMSTENNAGEKR